MFDEVGQAIYHRYYERAKLTGLIWLLSDWFVANGFLNNIPETDEDARERRICQLTDTFPHAHAVQTVLAYEISFWVFRHLNGPWGEMSDFYLHERNRFTNEYRQKTGYQIVGNSDDVLW